MSKESATRDEDMTGPIIRLWRRLPTLRKMSFVAEPGPASTTRWRGSGEADITATTAGNDRRLSEHGRFRPEGTSRTVVFANVYRWQHAGDRLRLYHERFGAKAPVCLIDLVAADEHRLICSRPHQCGDDRYHATLMLTEAGFILDWIVRGPRKDERLIYRYQP